MSLPRDVVFTATPAQYAALCQQAEANDIPISGPSGHATVHGCAIAWSYDPEHQRLTVTLESKPWLYPEDTVITQLTSAIGGALAKASEANPPSTGEPQ